MRCPIRWHGISLGGQRGASLILIAALMPLILAAMAMVIDVGVMLVSGSEVQTALNSAALAGARELPRSPANAIAVAQQYAFANDVSLAAGDVVISSTNATDDTITISRTSNVPLLFAAVLGTPSVNFSTSAKSVVGSLRGLNGVLPWVIVDSDPNPSSFGYAFGQSIILELGGVGTVDGALLTLATDGQGADIYRSGIANGSTNYIQTGMVLNTQTGEMNGPTRQGFDSRIGSDTFSFGEVVQVNADGTHTILNRSTPRLGTVAVSSQVVQSGLPVTVEGFALVFLESVDSAGPHIQVRLRFIDTVVVGEWGPLSPYGSRVVRLF